MDPSLRQAIVNKFIEGYNTYIDTFNALSRKAPGYFKERNWDEMQRNHRERLRLYKDFVRQVVSECQQLLSDQVGDRELWLSIKTTYSLQISSRSDQELAETFFNSVIRKAFPGMTVDEELMFVYEKYDRCEIHQDDLFYNYPQAWGLDKIFRTMLEDFDFGVPFYDKEACIQFLVQGVKEVILARCSPSGETALQVVERVSHRSGAGYLIGRAYIGQTWLPLSIPLLHRPKRVYVDPLLVDPDIMGGIFSCASS